VAAEMRGRLQHKPKEATTDAAQVV